MTYNEFYLKAILAMVSNPKYVSDGELQTFEILDEANTLSDKLSDCFEDDIDEPKESMKAIIDNISVCLSEISSAIAEICDAKKDTTIKTKQQ